MKKILVINCGSSSIKYSLFEMSSQQVLADGLVEQIGERTSSLKHKYRDDSGQMQEIKSSDPVANHPEGFRIISEAMRQSALLDDLEELAGIGHRVVHGGEDFSDPAIIDEHVLASIKDNVPLAPLHNPANLVGIETTLQAQPQIPQVAVFDTAFHQTLPPQAYSYALPHELYTKHKIRRYGFHGTSHFYVLKKTAAYLNKGTADLNIITLHLGNGASACAIQKGKSVDTSMGMTPLEGLVMGTRSGDIDSGILFHLSSETGYSIKNLDALLNKESGLKGICGANDMRSIIEMARRGNEQAQLAIDITSYRIKKYIGAYSAVLGHVDALVFTAGIGENSALIRFQSCAGLENLGLRIDPDKNEKCGNGITEIQHAEGPVKILVVPTDEELEIAEATLRCIEDTPRQ